MSNSNENENIEKESSSVQKTEKGLGKGLTALLGDSAAITTMGIKMSEQGHGNQNFQDNVSPKSLPIEKMVSGPYQPRIMFDEKNLHDLAESIKQHGIVQPLLVRPSGDLYEIIAGERRWRAAQIAGLHDVPVIIRTASDKMAAEIAMIENIQRDDLSPIEEAEGYRRLIEDFSYTQDVLAGVIGKSRSHLANMMRLLNLPEKVKNYVHSQDLTIGQARPLIGHKDVEDLADVVLAKGLNARQVEALVARDKNPKPPIARKSADLAALEKELREIMGLEIAIKYNESNETGSILIKTATLEQFEHIITTLNKK